MLKLVNAPISLYRCWLLCVIRLIVDSYVNQNFLSTDCWFFLETRREKHLAIMFLFTCYESQHFVAEQGAECQPFSSGTQGSFPKEDLLNSLHMAQNMMDYQKAVLFSLQCRYLSYLSCPAWWTKFISHEKCTLKTNLKCILDKWEGEHLTEGGWKVFGGGSLRQLEAVVWSVRHCEAIWRWSCSGSTQSVGSMVSHLVILMELPFQAHCQEVMQVAKTSKPWGTWYQWGRVALQSSIPGGICCGRFRLWYG